MHAHSRVSPMVRQSWFSISLDETHQFVTLSQHIPIHTDDATQPDNGTHHLCHICYESEDHSQQSERAAARNCHILYKPSVLLYVQTVGIMHIILNRKEDQSPVFTITNNITKHFCFHCLIWFSQVCRDRSYSELYFIDKEMEN